MASVLSDAFFFKFGHLFCTGQFVLKGDLDISVRTASKYNESKLLHLPNLRFWWVGEFDFDGKPYSTQWIQNALRWIPYNLFIIIYLF